ncbi:cupin [Halobacteriales archaeon QS_5_70_17]|nr:MAG: cupin [Halobacteriales archaeon QS_5_70_17]
MGYETASTDGVGSVTDGDDGGMWMLRDALGAENLGVTVLELEPGAGGTERDHAGDGHGEVYVVVEGSVDVDCDDETVTLDRGEAIRLSPDQRRRIVNRGEDRVRLVLAGAP